MGKVCISPGNIKMGSISSVSLPAYKTCAGDAPCYDLCYAAKMMRFRKNVKNSYENNLDILTSDPEEYWRQVEAAIMVARFFRFHVSGDIVDEDYLKHMVDIAARNSHCEILCFTKKYSLINKWIDKWNFIPDNLHIVFSVWKDYPYDNPYHLPEAHVRYKGGYTTANEEAFLCNGDCLGCATAGDGCWNLKSDEQVVFNQH